MSATDQLGRASGIPVSLESTMGRRRKAKNVASSIWLYSSLVIAVIPLGLVLLLVVQKGMAVFGWDFLTKEIPTLRQKVGPGMGPAVLGTIMITLAATLMAVPLGILGAVYLNEYGGKGRLAGVIRFMTNVMTGVPSIVMGLFIYVTWVLRFGQTGFAGSLALACLMLPIVIRSSEEMLKLVPDELRQASYALGSRKWRTILTVVLPAAIGGITSGCMLAVARAAGETAPLLFTIGVTTKFNPNLFSGPNTALAPQIFVGALQPYEGIQQRSWAAALTLILIVFLFTILARVVSSRYQLRHS